MRTGAKLGQHFLIHSWAARSLAHAAAPQAGETIVEIGPGKGVLTKELLALGPVIAIEKDEGLVRLLAETFSAEIAEGRLRIVSADIRNISPHELGVERFVVAANIPYYITGEIIRQFLTAAVQPRVMALLIQKEVAQRIVSGKGSILSMSVRAFGVPRIIDKVPKKHFSPPPSVDSAIIAIEHISRSFFADLSEQHFFNVVKAGFASKRKFVANNLASVYDRSAALRALERARVAEKARAEDLTADQWKRVAQELSV